MTVPEAEARTDVPVGAEMSMPSCMRPQRHPNPLVTTPLTGQIRPLEETPLPDEPPPLLCAERICAARAALAACSAERSSWASWRSCFVSDRRLLLLETAAERAAWRARSAARAARCSSVFSARTAVSLRSEEHTSELQSQSNLV